MRCRVRVYLLILELKLWLWSTLVERVRRLIGGSSISLGIGIRSGSLRKLGLAKGIGYPLARGCLLQGLDRGSQGVCVLVCVRVFKKIEIK